MGADLDLEAQSQTLPSELAFSEAKYSINISLTSGFYIMVFTTVVSL